MTASNQILVAQGSPSLVPLVQAAHAIWIKEVETNLLPIITAESSFWERWTVVRYMADDFLAQYQRERSLLDALHPFLPVTLSESLSREGKRIANLQQELDRVGRRRGTSRTVSVAARDLLESLRTWCLEIEAAAERVQHEVLPDEGQRALEHVELYIRAHG
jgi:hypothetical protein